MQTRLKTASVLILALLVVIWLDWYLLNLAIFLLVLVIALVEAFKLYKIENNDLIIVGVGLFVLAVILCNSFAGYYKFIVFTLLALSSWYAYTNSENSKGLQALLYPFAPLLIMWGIYDILGIKYLIYLIVIVATMDSGAYFAGKLFGSKTFTTTSPNKTIEGVIGGFVFVFFIGGGWSALFMGELNNSFLITFWIALASLFGDLFESYLKRKADVKDSGEIFPGHGGMLDRLDSYLFAAVGFSLVMIW
ncbi:MAG: phosphatidate cytidylyltransferase [Campylobacter sp.]|nr:phosphatidate cytidylyltransferase [Campylobacter sp.]